MNFKLTIFFYQFCREILFKETEIEEDEKKWFFAELEKINIQLLKLPVTEGVKI